MAQKKLVACSFCGTVKLLFDAQADTTITCAACHHVGTAITVTAADLVLGEIKTGP